MYIRYVKVRRYDSYFVIIAINYLIVLYSAFMRFSMKDDRGNRDLSNHCAVVPEHHEHPRNFDSQLYNIDHGLFVIFVM